MFLTRIHSKYTFFKNPFDEKDNCNSSFYQIILFLFPVLQDLKLLL